MPDTDETLNRTLPAARARAMGRSVQAAADAAGVGPKTGYRWRSGKQFKVKVRQLRQEVLDTALGRLLSALPAAWDTLTELLGPTHQEGTRLWAAVALLEQATRYHSDVDLAGQIAELQRQLDDEQRLPP